MLLRNPSVVTQVGSPRGRGAVHVVQRVRLGAMPQCGAVWQLRLRNSCLLRCVVRWRLEFALWHLQVRVTLHNSAGPVCTPGGRGKS